MENKLLLVRNILQFILPCQAAIILPLRGYSFRSQWRVHMSKSLAKNSLYNLLYKGVTVVFPLLTSMYVAHILKAEGVGKVSYAHTVANYFAVLAALGIPNYGIKAVAQNNSSKEQVSRVFFELLFINAVSTSICAIAYYTFVNSLHYFQGRELLLNISGIIILLNFFNVDWFYKGIENYKYISIRGTIIKIISFIAVVLIVKSEDDYLFYAIILCVALAGNYLINFVHIQKYIVYKRYKLELGNHIWSILILAASTIATEIYTMLDTVMIEYYYGERYVGLYSNSTRFVRVIYSICIASVATFYPRISYFIKQNMQEKSDRLFERGVQLIILFVVPCVVGTILLSRDIIIGLYGISFIEATMTLKIVSILILVFSFAYFLGHIVLMATGNEKTILLATIGGALANMMLNFILIPRFKHNGAAVASVIAEIIVTTILINKGKCYFKVHLNKRDCISEAIALFVMSGLVIVMTKFLNSTIERLVIIIPCAAIVYFTILLLLKNQPANYLFNAVIKIIHRIFKRS